MRTSCDVPVRRQDLDGLPSRQPDTGIAEIDRLLGTIQEALRFDLIRATEDATRLARLLASKTSQACRPAPVWGGLAPWQIHKIRRYIEDGLDDKLPIEEIADLIPLSAPHFSRAFKQSFGETPHAYIVRLRIERAKALMLSTSESLSQVALACGLADQSHLCRLFRKFTGASPAAWRREQRQLAA